MQSFSIAIFRFYFNPLEEIRLPPYKGSAFRGGFGSVFKRVVCVNKEEDCKDCLLKFKCVYSYVFETPIDDRVEFKTTHMPHPYVIEPPLENRTRYLPGDLFSVNLILVGKAIDYLPYFIFVMEMLGKNGIGKGRGRFLIERAENLSHPFDTEGKVIFDAKTKRLLCDMDRITFTCNKGEEENNICRSLSLHFLTPTRITFRNRLTTPSDFNFPVFTRNLLRRINLLSHHCDTRLQIDYKNLLIQAESVQTNENRLYWYDWERYSARQDTRMKLGGFKGKVTFYGPISPFLSLIKIGEYVHVGNDTSFGLGRYVIDKIVEKT